MCLNICINRKNKQRKNGRKLMKQQNVGAVYIYIYIRNFIKIKEGKKAFVNNEFRQTILNKKIACRFCAQFQPENKILIFILIKRIKNI